MAKFDKNDGFGDFKITNSIYNVHPETDVKGASLANTIIALFAVVLLLLMTCSLIRGGDNITFTAFLEFLSQQGTNFAMTNFVDYSIVGDWGLFNFLKDFLNILMIPISVTVYVLKFAWNVLVFLLGLVQFLFGF